MRYGDGGGLDQAARARREQVRLQAAGLFARGVSALDVAGMLEVSPKSAYQWRRAWIARGPQALVSRGAPGPDPVLSDSQLAQLKVRLEQGPAAAGYEQDPRWTLARILTLIGAMFHVRVGITTVWQAMGRLGYTPQLPARRALERDDAIARWRRCTWPGLKEWPSASGRGSALPTSAATR